MKKKPKVSPGQSHPAIGMWADREDMKNPSKYVRRLRRGRKIRGVQSNEPTGTESTNQRSNELTK